MLVGIASITSCAPPSTDELIIVMVQLVRLNMYTRMEKIDTFRKHVQKTLKNVHVITPP